jgi:L-seryl-tRNA(Ser) seleniumtransferase
MHNDIYAELGIKPVINAMGNVTVLGGSNLSPGVQAAMEAANRHFAPMEEVLEKTGQAIAEMLGAENAYVTSGCFAALVLGIAGILSGGDRERIARLPDTSGMKNEFLLQKPTRYHYDRCITVPGGKLVEVGDDTGVSTAQFEAAIGPNTAGILFFARGELIPGTLKLHEVVAVAHRHGIPVIVDAASEIYPVERMTSLAAGGADLICFGAKYLGAQNSAGILCGRSDLIEAARLNGFIGYERQRTRSMGRGYKLDRQEVIGVTVALREWLTLDHEERLQSQAERIDQISAALAGLPHVRTERQWNSDRDAWMRLHITLDNAKAGASVHDVEQRLRDGEPSIRVRTEGDHLVLMVHTLQESEMPILIERLHKELA